MQLYQPEHQLSAVVAFGAKNTGFTLSVAYLLLTLCGIFYADAFYAQFEIPYLKLAETSDLLIIGISEPAALLMFFLAIMLTIGFDYITRKTYQWQQYWKQQPASLKRRAWMIFLYVPKYKVSVLVSLVFLFVLYAFVFVTLYAEWHSERVKNGRGDQVLVTLDVEGPQVKGLLLGSTANHLFTYDVDTDSANIYPVQHVVRIAPVAAPEASAAADTTATNDKAE
ncbi:hypothetical protein LJ739_08705 [Aestuariibacter halophilus]|uniref:Uncharacterized protein n=1 Tax=Fluctibacter halophilus TaxID=226011 RepID=A0ABS8G719_9ALTE|nr:hypothetical protein [Aestuariibacter halophilus]MCC2616318.1 hypothetical protein [Aestuariibacter halophilus]